MQFRGIAAFWVAVLIGLAAPTESRAEGPFALVAGRWEPSLIVVDLSTAVMPANDGTSNAVVSRVRVTADIDGASSAPAAGLPSNVVVAADGMSAWVVNHAGNATTAEAARFAHGHPGTLTVLDLPTALDPANDGTTNAIQAIITDVGFGPVGVAETNLGPFGLIGSSEGADTEDGGRALSIVDLDRAQRVATVPLALGNGGQVAQAPERSCERLVEEPSLRPRALPDGDVGCFPNVNGIVLSERFGAYAFTANGGTDDVSVIDVSRAVAGDPGAEIARIPVDLGPWGIAVNPDGTAVAVANRESSETGIEGNTISILDVETAIGGDSSGAEIARVMVGTDDQNVATRPFGLAFTPDGQAIIVANFRTDNVSIVDVARVLEGRADAELARIALTTQTSEPARPRGVAVSADGRFAAISGGVRDAENGGWLWVIDLGAREVVATVTHVGNEPYGLAIVDAPQ